MVKYSKEVVRLDVILIIFFGVMIFAGANLIIYYISKGNEKRKTKLGVLMLILSPVVFYGTYSSQPFLITGELAQAYSHCFMVFFSSSMALLFYGFPHRDLI